MNGMAHALSDDQYMHMALSLAKRGWPESFPNPSVGAVIISAQNRIIGRGWTQAGGRPHGEAMALAQAGDRAKGATIYVTLEPCAHDSARGLSCTDSLITAGVKRVVIAMQDPDPRTNGQGIKRLKQAGISITTGICADKSRRHLAGFTMQKTHGRPFVTLKLATSLDGQIAMANGESQWITGAAARAHGHKMRSLNNAILVGRGTFKADNPQLNVRLPGLAHTSPKRILLSASMANAPHGWQLITTPQDIHNLPDAPHRLMVEGGAQTAAAFIHAGLVDRLLLYRAPIILGRGMAALGDIGLNNLAQAHGQWQLTKRAALGDDHIEIYDKNSEKEQE